MTKNSTPGRINVIIRKFQCKEKSLKKLSVESVSVKFIKQNLNRLNDERKQRIMTFLCISIIHNGSDRLNDNTKFVWIEAFECLIVKKHY